METILKCEGLEVGKLTIPSFELKEGEIIHIQLKCNLDSPVYKKIINYFTETISSPSIKISQEVSFSVTPKNYKSSK